MKDKVKKILKILLILICTGLILFSAYNLFKIYKGLNDIADANSDIVDEFSEKVENGDNESINYAYLIPMDEMEDEEGNKIPLTTTYYSKMVGIMRIPAMDVEAPIALGANKENLSKYIGIYEEYGNIGEEKSNAVFAAHSSIYSVCGHCYFQKMGDYLEKGDRITIEWMDGNTYEYSVSSVTNWISPDEEWPYSQKVDKEMITLVTCTNGNAEYRTVVQADWIRTIKTTKNEN